MADQSEPSVASSALKQFLGWTLVIWLIVVAFGLVLGTIGGIHDNIQFKDWFSVTMWAIFGPIGFSGAGAGAVLLAFKLSR
jgi:hypothetical protein